MSKWILTDDSSMQYVRKVEGEEDIFDLIEMCLVGHNDGGIYEVYENTICVDDYLETMRGETVEILNSFGYADIEDVMTQYEDAAQVIAECIFEYYGSFQARQVFVGTEQDCNKWITDYVNREES